MANYRWKLYKTYLPIEDSFETFELDDSFATSTPRRSQRIVDRSNESIELAPNPNERVLAMYCFQGSSDTKKNKGHAGHLLLLPIRFDFKDAKKSIANALTSSSEYFTADILDLVAEVPWEYKGKQLAMGNENEYHNFRERAINYITELARKKKAHFNGVTTNISIVNKSQGFAVSWSL